MANSPVVGYVPYFTKNGVAPASGYWIKGYVPGTTTPLTMYTDSTTGTPLAKAEINSMGFPATSGGSIFAPHFAAKHDLWLFPTEAAADANDTSGATKVVANGTLIPVVGEVAKMLATVAAMKADATLIVGDTVRTLEHTAGYGYEGGWLYKITASSGTGHILLDNGLYAEPVVQSESIHFEHFGAAGDGATDDSTVMANALTFAQSSGKVLEGISSKTYVANSTLTFEGVKTRGNGAVILSVIPSTTVENDSVYIDGDGTEFEGWTLQGGASGAALYDDRTYRGVKVLKSAKNFKVHSNKFLYYKVAGWETDGIDSTDELPEDGSFWDNTVDGGSHGCLNGGIIMGGRRIEVYKNKALNVFNQGFSVSDASRLTPISEYAANYDVDVHHNHIEIIDPPATVTQTAADAGIKIGGGLRLSADDNTIIYRGSKTDPAVSIGKGIELKLYDVAQQKARNDGTLGTGEGVYFPHDQKEALPKARRNTVVGLDTGVFLNGCYAADIEENTLVVTQIGIETLTQGATIGGTTYNFPSAETAGYMRALLKVNRIISLDTRAIGSGNAFVAVSLGTNYNRSIDNEFMGTINARYGGTNLGVQNWRSDADGRTYGVSDKAKGDLAGTTDVPAGFTNRTVSGPLTQGGSAKMELAYEGTVSDYVVNVEPLWDTTWWISSKTANSFQVNFGTAPAADTSFNWQVVPITAEIT